MVSIAAGSGTHLYIVGHGLRVDREVRIAEGLFLSPETPPAFDGSFGSTTSTLQAHAAMLAMERIATFSLRVEHPAGGKELVAKAWNALWLFSLLSLACRSPVVSLYSIAEGRLEPSPANRNLIIRPAERNDPFSDEQLQWTRGNHQRFDKLVVDRQFSAAQRYYNSAHYLPDPDARLMLLWAGIEGLLNVDGELRRRIALHAAILHDGDREQKIALFRDIKRAYDIRSKVVHGAQADGDKLNSAVIFAGELLVGLLRKMVEMGRVPPTAELDEAAASLSFG
jgi:hypothetical protein